MSWKDFKNSFVWFWVLFSPLKGFVETLPVQVAAPCALLMNAETGAILYEKQAHTPCYPASITKIATALFLLDRKEINLQEMASVSAECLRMKSEKDFESCPPYWLEVSGTKMGLLPGEKISHEALLHGLMLISGNDAANVLAKSVCGSVAGFVEEMNAYIQELGCTKTRFQNPHGLHHPEHYTTAYDIGLIAQRALQVPLFKEIVSRTRYEKPRTNKQGPAVLKQSNALLNPKNTFYYPKAIGLKTGYTASAKNTLVAAAEHEGRILLAVVLGCQTRADRYQDVIRLFNAAFAEEKKIRGLFGLRHVLRRKIEGGNIPLEASLKEDLSISYYPSEEPICKAFVEWKIPSFPISKGQVVGDLVIRDEKGNLLAKQELFARKMVKQTWLSWGSQKLFGKKTKATHP